MPQYYAILDNGVSNSKGKAMPTRKKYVRSYLKSKGVKPTRDASMRSKREKRLRGEARSAYAKLKSTPKATTRTSGSSKTGSVNGGKKIVTARKETGEDRENYRNSKIPRSNPLSPAERRSGGLGNSKRERTRNMSAAEARWLDYGPKNRAIVVAKNPRPANKNYRKGKNR